MINPQDINNNPQLEILQHSVKVLTKDWPEEQKEEFSKKCFDEVCIERYNTRRRVPQMNIAIQKQ